MLYRLKPFTFPFCAIICRISFVVVAGLLSVSVGLAQNVGGKVTGRVTDPSGAVIPGARIHAQNINTNVVNETQSDGVGYYVLQLPIGDYRISASASGFETVAQQNLTVLVGSDVGLDFHLVVGATKTVVQVTGETIPLIRPDSPTIQTEVPNDLVENLPIQVSSSPRNADEFLTLLPGTTGTGATASLMNGGSTGSQYVTTDGATVGPAGFNTGSQSEYGAMPVPTFAVQEFQVIGANGDADVGHSSSGSVSYVIKSGTNKFHGSLFELNRNTDYDAKTYFESVRGPDHQNEYGGEVGGPIQRDKTFFYGYFDGFRYSTANTGSIYSVLTAAMKAGNFSAAGIPAIYDPSTTASNGSGGFTRQQFSYNGVLNVIPPTEISPVSAYFAGLMPNPNLSGLTNNYIGTSTATNNSNQYLIKVDHTFGPANQLSGSMNWEQNPTTTNCPFGYDLCGNSGTTTKLTLGRAILNWTGVLSRTMVNHFTLSWNRLHLIETYGGQTCYGTSSSCGSDYNLKAGFTYASPSGMTMITASPFWIGNGSNLNDIAHGSAEVGNDFSWLHGAHQMKFGFQYIYYSTIGTQGAYGYTNWGMQTFSPLETAFPSNASTGYTAASFLVGNVDVGALGQNPGQAMIQPYWSVYGQDAWKIRTNLTLSYGLRWEYTPPVHDRDDRLANFDPTLPNPGAGNILGALIYAGSGLGGSGLSTFGNPWRLGFGPRIGLTYALRPTTVFRAGYGLMFDQSDGPSVHLNQQGYYANDEVASTNNGINPAFNWNTGFPPLPLGPNLVSTFANGLTTSYIPPNGWRMPQVESYNVGLQQKIWAGIVLDAAYVGTQSHHMYLGTDNYNSLNPRYLSLGSTLDAQIGSAQANAAGIAAPYPGYTGSVAQALVPYPQVEAITLLNCGCTSDLYQSLQIKAQMMHSHGISVLASYTWSKETTNNFTSQEYYNTYLDNAPASTDTPQRFVAAYSYELPFGESKLLSFSNKVANSVIGGWTASGIVTLQSGIPISPTTSLSLPAIGAIRPNVLPGVALKGPDDKRGVFNPRTESYINKAAFAAPAAFTFGDAPPDLGDLRAFGIKHWDAALMKKIPITEGVNLTVQGEFFNLLNTVNFGAPASNFSTGTFGTITTVNGNARNGQMSLTLTF